MDKDLTENNKVNKNTYNWKKEKNAQIYLTLFLFKYKTRHFIKIARNTYYFLQILVIISNSEFYLLQAQNITLFI